MSPTLVMGPINTGSFLRTFGKPRSHPYLGLLEIAENPLDYRTAENAAATSTTATQSAVENG